MRSHAWIDRRSLALHEAVASKIEARPELLDVARANVARWNARAPRPALMEWQHLLDQLPLPRLLDLLRADDENAAGSRARLPES